MDSDYFDFNISKISDEQFEHFLRLIPSNIITYSKGLPYIESNFISFVTAVSRSELDFELIFRQQVMRKFRKLNKTTSQIRLIMNITFFDNFNHHFMQNVKFRM